MHGNRAAISHSHGHTGGGKGFEPSGPNEENYAHETAPFDRYGVPFDNKGPMRLLEGPTVRIRLPPGRVSSEPRMIDQPVLGREQHRSDHTRKFPVVPRGEGRILPLSGSVAGHYVTDISKNISSGRRTVQTGQG